MGRAKRESLGDQAARLISDKAYAPFMVAISPADIVVNDVHGSGLTTKLPPVALNAVLLWDSVGRKR